MTDAILDRLMRLHPKLIDLELGRIERLLADVGSPHLKLPPVVHVAGTNGKGSLVAYLRAMAEAAGYRVHVYTSPHLVRFNERIRVAGELIERRRARGRADRGRAGQSGTAHHLLRDHHGRGVPRLRPRARPTSPCSRSGWAGAGHHQRGQSGALGHHADRLRPHGLPRRHAGEDRRREGRHPEAHRAGGDRPPARGERRGDRRQRPPSLPCRCSAWAANGRSSRRRPASATTATFWASTCRRRRWSARIRSTMPRPRSPASSGCARRSSASTMRRSGRAWRRSTGRPACRS